VRPASKHQVNTYVRPLIASAMIAGGLLQLAAPIYAAGTAAGSDISNTATASYEDPNTPNVPLNTVSNTVSVKVEKVAGITIDSLGATDTTAPGKYEPGDTVNFDYVLTNKGNSAVKFSIPGFATVNTAGDFQKVQYFAGIGATGADATGWKDIPNGGATVPADMPVVAVDGTMKARVVVVVRAGTAANTPLNVQLGQTAIAPGVNTPTENVVRANDAGDVYTIDITNSIADAPLGAAVNGVREAAALQTVNVSAKNKAFVDINMTGAVTSVDPTDPKKNKVTYDINVKVDPNAPTTGTDAGKNPTDLAATEIQLDPGTGTASKVNRVLISDPVPAGTTPTALVAPPGWTAVYSLTDSTTVSTTNPVVWKTGTLPTTGVTFVGFIKNDDQPLAKSPTPYTGFKVELQTTGADPTAPTTVNNIATVYGTTPGADGKTPDLTKPVSDQTGTPNVVDSVPNSPVPVPVTITPVTPLSLFNGPLNKPEATGADSSPNTDFTNKSAEIKATDATVTDPITGALTPLATPLPVGFNNTVENKGTVATDIYLLPTAPVDKTSLPTGTVVSISYGSDTRTYTYDGAGKYTPNDTTKLPIVIPAVASGTTKDYGVSVTLPKDTPQLKGYTAPITAFAFDTTDTVAKAALAADVATVPATASSNTTLDNVYTGFIKLEKEARILTSATDANSATPAFSKGTKDPVTGLNVFKDKPLPGQFIQYRIKYTNISTGGGTDNVLLKAGKLNIIEDGAAPNTWAAVTDNVVGSANDNSGGTVKFFNGTNSSPDVVGVSKYVVDMTTPGVVIAPQGTGNFTFLRQVK
jgi:hypothetical protein